MENCNCNSTLHHEYHEAHKENVMIELDAIFQKLKSADWAKIYGNIHENHQLMLELAILRNNIQWEDLKGCIYHNEDLMKLLNDLRNNISWSDIKGDVASSTPLIDKIKELIVKGLESDKFNDEFLKRTLDLLLKISKDFGFTPKLNEIYTALTEVINRYFRNEEHEDDSVIYKEIIIGLTHQIHTWLDDFKSNDQMDAFLERLVQALLKFFASPKGLKYTKELWDILIKFLEENPDTLESLWDVLFKYPKLAKRLMELLLDYLETDGEDDAVRLWNILLKYLKKYQALADKLWDILYDYLNAPEGEEDLDKLINLLLKRLLELIENPDNSISKNLINLIKKVLGQLSLNDLKDVSVGDMSDNYEYFLVFDKSTKTWINKRHTWTGPKNQLPTNREKGVQYYVTE